MQSFIKVKSSEKGKCTSWNIGFCAYASDIEYSVHGEAVKNIHIVKLNALSKCKQTPAQHCGAYYTNCRCAKIYSHTHAISYHSRTHSVRYTLRTNWKHDIFVLLRNLQLISCTFRLLSNAACCRFGKDLGGEERKTQRIHETCILQQTEKKRQ